LELRFTFRVTVAASCSVLSRSLTSLGDRLVGLLPAGLGGRADPLRRPPGPLGRVLGEGGRLLGELSGPRQALGGLRETFVRVLLRPLRLGAGGLFTLGRQLLLLFQGTLRLRLGLAACLRHVLLGLLLGGPYPSVDLVGRRCRTSSSRCFPRTRPPWRARSLVGPLRGLDRQVLGLLCPIGALTRLGQPVLDRVLTGHRIPHCVAGALDQAPRAPVVGGRIVAARPVRAFVVSRALPASHDALRGMSFAPETMVLSSPVVPWLLCATWFSLPVVDCAPVQPCQSWWRHGR
jgi:hypothetical protein